LTKIKRFNLVLKSLKLCFYILFLVANKNTYTRAISVANIRINTFKKFKNVDAIIAFVGVTSSLYINKSSNNS